MTIAIVPADVTATETTEPPLDKVAQGFKVDPDFAAMLPALSPEEFDALRESIKRDGITDPYTVWREQNILIDGHHRESIRIELDVKLPAINYVSFPDRLAAAGWVFQKQNARRNWSPQERALAVLKNEELVAKLVSENRARMASGKKTGTKAEHTNTALARVAGISEGTIKNTKRDIQTIMTSGEPEIIAQFTSKDPGKVIGIKQALSKIRVQKEHDKRNVQRGNKIPLPPVPDEIPLDKIILADCIDGLKSVPDSSVTLTITSPPYMIGEVKYENPAVDYTNYFEALDALEKRFALVYQKTKTSGRCIIQIDTAANREGDKADRSKLDMPKTQCVYADMVKMMRGIGWHFLTEICWYKQNSIGARPNWGTYCSPACPNIRRQHEYMLCFHKGPAYLPGEIADISEEEFKDFTMSHWYIRPERRKETDDPDYHPCPYPQELVYRLIKLFSYRGDTVLDPYCGSGTTPFVAKALGRRFIGIDCGPSYVASAQRRITTLDGKTPAEMEAMITRYVHTGPKDGYGPNLNKRNRGAR